MILDKIKKTFHRYTRVFVLCSFFLSFSFFFLFFFFFFLIVELDIIYAVESVPKVVFCCSNSQGMGYLSGNCYWMLSIFGRIISLENVVSAVRWSPSYHKSSIAESIVTEDILTFSIIWYSLRNSSWLLCYHIVYIRNLAVIEIHIFILVCYSFLCNSNCSTRVRPWTKTMIA